MATVTRENIGLLNDKITVKVAGDDYLPSFEKAIKSYSKSANIPGFRKGMVPAGMIKKMHGQAVFTDEVLKTVEKELTNYVNNEKLEIFAQPIPLDENDARSIDMNNPREYAFAFEVGLKPDFKLADLASEKITRYKVTVTDDMVNEEVGRLQLRHGKMTDPETVTGDDNVINVTFTESDAEGNAVEGGITKDNSLLVKYFAPAFRSNLIGKKKDDTLVLQLNNAFEEKEREWVLQDLGLDKHDAAAGEKYFKLLITKVGLVEKAEPNEEFFKTVYPDKEIKTEEEFRNAIREEIQSHWDKQAGNHMQHEIYHVLIDHTHIDFPETFLKRWIQQGGEKPKTAEEVDHEFPGFINQLKWNLITDKVTHENKIEVQREDIEGFARQQLFGYMGGHMIDAATGAEQPWVADYITRMMNDRKFVEDAYHRIQTNKVFEWAEGQVNAVEKPVSVDEFTKELEKHEHHHH
jgi:trigger factor